MDNFGDEATLPKLKLSIRKTAQEDFVELYDEVFSNDSPLSDHWKQNVTVFMQTLAFRNVGYITLKCDKDGLLQTI